MRNPQTIETKPKIRKRFIAVIQKTSVSIFKTEVFRLNYPVSEEFFYTSIDFKRLTALGLKKMNILMCHMVVSSVASLRHELFQFESTHVQLIILAFFSHKVFMVASLDDTAVFHNHYDICVLYRR